MLLTEKKYLDLVKDTTENNSPGRIAKYLHQLHKKHSAENAEFWHFISMAATSLYPEYDFDVVYDLKKIIENDKDFASDEDKLVFIHEYAGAELEKKIELQRYDKRHYTLNELLALVQWVNNQLVDPDGIKYKFSKDRINFYTNAILNLVLNEHLLEEEALMKSEKNNLSLYIKIYFSNVVLQREIRTTDEIAFVDYRKPRLPFAYVVIGNTNKLKDFGTVFSNRCSRAMEQKNITETKFKNLEAARWRNIKKLFTKSTTEYNLINQYLRYLPKLKVDKTISGRYSFGIDMKHRDKISELITKIMNQSSFVFFQRKILLRTLLIF